MRRLALASIVAACALLLAACGGARTASPVPQTVEGTLPKAQPPAKGNTASGKAVFASSGCSGCHTYTPANAHGTVGPNLDHLATDAQKANRGALDAYTRESIVDPNAY